MDFGGYSLGQGPGTGLSSTAYTGLLAGSGGGHGGRGGRSRYGIYSALAYGSAHQPREMGSGGGQGGNGGRGSGTYMYILPIETYEASSNIQTMDLLTLDSFD